MKFSPDRPYSDPDTAARKLLEITNAVEAVAGWPHPCEVHAGGSGSIRLSKVPSVDQRMRLGMRCRLSPTADVSSHTSGAAMCQ